MKEEGVRGWVAAPGVGECFVRGGGADVDGFENGVEGGGGVRRGGEAEDTGEGGARA